MEMTAPVVDGPEGAPPVILLHGSGGSGQGSWRQQLPLAARWRLIRPTRRGWVPGGELPAGWSEMAVDVVELLDRVGPAHLVGFSYGGLVAMTVAAERPGSTLSLAVLDAPVLGLVPDDPAVAVLVARLSKVYQWARSGRIGPGQFYDLFERAHGLGDRPWTEDPPSVDVPLDPAEEDMARRWIAETEVWRFRPRTERLAGIPALVVTGSFHPAIDVAGAILAAQLEAELVVFPEGRHNVTLLPDRLNPLLERLWTAATPAGRRPPQAGDRSAGPV